MTTVTFNTLAFSERLKASGVPESQAKEHAMALSDAFEAKDLATKQDIKIAIAELETSLIKWVVGTGLAIVGIMFALLRFMPPS
ncbi:MAG: DUF1640 domain-containing protein [Magnetococcales bacterium]|nr:DUF1640 domain-containing protein [Magnetococcales bacterium]